MANSKRKPPSSTDPDDKDARRILYARVPEAIYSKLQRMAARRSAKAGERITLQDTVIELIKAAP